LYKLFIIYDNFYFKPGGVFKEDWCTVCQCINNAYICDNSSCEYKPTTDTIELTTQKSYQTTVLDELTTPTTKNPLSTTETKITSTEYMSTVKWPDTTITPSPYLIVSTTLPTEEFSTVKSIKTTPGEIIFIPSTVSPPMVMCDVNG